VMAKHRAKAKVLLDDIGFPQNEVMIKSGRINPDKQTL
jgi:hypothetical protein